MTAVVVLGDVGVDVLTVMHSELRPGTDTTATVRSTGGGAGANVACWLASLGVEVTLMAAVGDDAAGQLCRDELTSSGVGTALAVYPDAATGCVVVLVDPAGERSMLCDRGANLVLSPADLPEALFRPGAHLHLSGYTLLHDGPRAAGLRALQLARAAGMTISVDPASTAPLAAYGPDGFLADTAGADLLLPNLAEAQLLSGEGEPAAAALALAQRYGAVVVTCGADGAVWAGGGAAGQQQAEPGGVRDTTGAGDAFTAGLLAAWLTSAPLPECASAGSQVAARAITVLGARPS